MHLKEKRDEGILDSFDLEQGDAVGFCKHSNGHSDPKNHCQYLNNYSVPWS
jgi:hypothetical protein